MLNNQSSLSEITESIRHINEVFLPSVKQKLASKTYYSADNTFEALIDNIALDKLGGVKWARGSEVFVSDVNGRIKPSVTGLDFTPSFVLLSYPSASQTYDRIHILDNRFDTRASTSTIIVEGNGFSCNALNSNFQYTNRYIYWMAVE